MPQLDTRAFRKKPNIAILNAVRNEASNDYQERIPEATKSNVHDVIANLMNYSPNRNEFVNALINKVGMTIARQNIWTNPLAVFKLGLMQYGESIEEIQAGLVSSYTYDPTRSGSEQAIFGAETPEVQANYHVINRQEYYKITINQAMLTRAFASEYGLSSLISSLMEAPTTSDQWDEYLLMTSLFKEYEDNNGYFKVNIPDVESLGSDSADAKFALRRLREMAENLTFISRRYNAAGMPVAAKREDMVIFTTPEFKAALDVEALAAAFNIDRADVPSRMVTVRKEDFGIEGAQAILTTEDFFVVADTLLETRSAENPVGLYENYFLHHHQIMSVSRFVPAVMLTTEPSTPIILNPYTVSGITTPAVYDDEFNTVSSATPLEVARFYQVTAEPVSDPEDADTNGVRVSWSGPTSPRSFYNQEGSFYLAADETAESVTFTFTSNDDESVTATLTKGITPGEGIWPRPVVEPPAEDDGGEEPTPGDGD